MTDEIDASKCNLNHNHDRESEAEAELRMVRGRMDHEILNAKRQKALQPNPNRNPR